MFVACVVSDLLLAGCAVGGSWRVCVLCGVFVFVVYVHSTARDVWSLFTGHKQRNHTGHTREAEIFITCGVQTENVTAAKVGAAAHLGQS